MRVVLTCPLPEAVETEFRRRFDTQILGTASADDLQQALYRADVLCPTVTNDLSNAFFQAVDPSRLRTRLIANFGVGHNHIDLGSAAKLGLAVTNTPDVLTDATADLTILLMLMAARRAGEGERQVRAGAWAGWQPKQLMGRQVTGARLGIIGMGRIGQAVAQRARAGFGMNVRYFSRTALDSQREQALCVQRCSTVEALIAESDFVSLHCPSTPETRHLINETTLKAFSSDSYLINTARGQIVDEAALAKALARGDLAGAGLDVYEREPEVHPALLGLENVVLLPHLGSATRETRVAMGQRMLKNVLAFEADEPLPDRLT